MGLPRWARALARSATRSKRASPRSSHDSGAVKSSCASAIACGAHCTSSTARAHGHRAPLPDRRSATGRRAGARRRRSSRRAKRGSNVAAITNYVAETSGLHRGGDRRGHRHRPQRRLHRDLAPRHRRTASPGAQGRSPGRLRAGRRVDHPSGHDVSQASRHRPRSASVMSARHRGRPRPRGPPGASLDFRHAIAGR
jgi:hypothetical protein